MVNRVLMIILIVMVGISIAFTNETISNKGKRIHELEIINRDLLEASTVCNNSVIIMTHMVEAYNKVLSEKTYQPYTVLETFAGGRQ